MSVKLLNERGCDFRTVLWECENEKDAFETPLHIAVRNNGHNVELIKYLIGLGVKVNYRGHVCGICRFCVK